MEDREVFDDVRTRLIRAGQEELLVRGVSDFSLRRVALSAQVSCAAPYRHFKNKEELIGAIVDRLREDWMLLTSNISEIFPDVNERIAELCVSGVRFWIANGNLRSVLTSSEGGRTGKSVLSSFDYPMTRAVGEYSAVRGLDAPSRDMLVFTLLSLLYGAVMLIGSGADADATIANMRKKIEAELR